MPNKKNTPHYIGHRKRLKKRFIKSPESFEDYEILELLLSYGLPRKDTKSLAKSLLLKFNTLKETIFASDTELLETKGISEGLLTFLKLIKEVIIRIEEQSITDKKNITNPQDVFNYLKTKLGLLDKENFYMLLLNTKNKIISLEKIQQGTIDCVKLYPRELLEIILKKRAANVIFIHNHPSGDPNPSQNDIKITQKLERLFGEIDVVLLDHLIIAHDSYYSFKENNLI